MNDVTTTGQTEPPAEAASTSVSVSAAFIIAGQSVSVTSQDITKIKEQGFKFALAAPVTLGTITDLLKWINEQFGTDIKPDDIKTSLDSIPIQAIKDILVTFWDMSLVVEVLNIDTKTGLFEIAIMLVAKEPPTILGVLKIEKLGFGVTRIGAPDQPEV